MCNTDRDVAKFIADCQKFSKEDEAKSKDPENGQILNSSYLGSAYAYGWVADALHLILKDPRP